MERLNASSRVDGALIRNLHSGESAKAAGHWVFRCFDESGRLKWQEGFHNIVVNVGLNHILSVVLAADTQITAWYVGLCNASPVGAAADTMSSHSGWTENQAYSESTRQAFTPGTVASQSVDNSASKATFNINTNGQTLGGAFLVGGTGSSSKGGTSGTLYSVGAFTLGDKSLDNGDKLEVTCTFTQADDGV